MSDYPDPEQVIKCLDSDDPIVRWYAKKYIETMLRPSVFEKLMREKGEEVDPPTT